MARSTPHVSIILPTLDESGTIKELVESLEENINRLQMQIIIIDDGSTDGTIEIVYELMKKHGNIVLLERDRKLGFGTAIREGLRTALELEPATDFMVTMDADLSHDPRDFLSLVDSCDRDTLVVGSRYIEGGENHGWSLYRKMVSKGANLMARVLTDMPVRDCTSGYRCYGADLVRAILPALESVGFDIQIEALYEAAQNGFEIIEVPISFRDRTSGESNLKPEQIGEFVKRVFTIARKSIGQRDRSSVLL